MEAHRDVLKWPDGPVGFREDARYTKACLDTDRMIHVGDISFTSHATKEEYAFGFLRVLVPRLRDWISIDLPRDLVSLVVDYYGDMVRLIGAKHRHTSIGIDEPIAIHYGYNELTLMYGEGLLKYRCAPLSSQTRFQQTTHLHVIPSSPAWIQRTSKGCYLRDHVEDTMDFLSILHHMRKEGLKI